MSDAGFSVGRLCEKFLEFTGQVVDTALRRGYNWSSARARVVRNLPDAPRPGRVDRAVGVGGSSPWVGPSRDSLVSLGVRWATRVTSIGLEFALPALLGGYLDRRFGTGSLLTIVGAVFGFVAGMVHLLAIAREDARRTRRAGPGAAGESTSDGSNASAIGIG